MEKKQLFGVCPYVTSQRVLTGKWSIYILYLLQDGPVRFNELLRRIPANMTHSTLSKQLKTLEDEGLIVRRAYSEIPPRVEYEVSDIGRRFKPVLEALKVWGDDYIDYVKSGNAPKMAAQIEGQGDRSSW